MSFLSSQRGVNWTLAILAVVLVLTRLQTIEEPLEWDITTYALIGRGLLEGRALYSDLWDHKPPGVHIVFAAAQAVFPHGQLAVFVLNIVCNLICFIGLFRLVRRQTSSTFHGIWAAAFWVLLSGDLGLQANQPNVELLLNAAMIWGWFFWLRLDYDRFNLPCVAAIGFLFAAASICKQLAVIHAGFLALTHIVCADRGSRRQIAMTQAVLIAAIGATCWGLVLGYFAWQQRLQDFRDAIFIYNHFYAGDWLRNIYRGLQPQLLMPLAIMGGTAALAVLLPMGLLLTRWKRRPRLPVFLVGYTVATVIAVALPGRFYPHYYQFWLPIFCVGGAYALWTVRQRDWVGAMRGDTAVGVAVLVITLVLQAQYWRMNGQEASQFKYGSIYIESQMAGAEIAELLRPDESFYVWGPYSGLYFYSGRMPDIGVFYNYPLLTGPLAEALSQRVIGDLDTRPPDLFVVDRGTSQSTLLVPQWFQGKYRFAKTAGIRFNFYSRIGSELDQRLSGADNKQETP